MNYSRLNLFLGFIGIVLIVFLSYSKSFQNGYVWDDDSYVTEERLAGIDGLKKIWTDPTSTDHLYYPITHTSFWLENKVFGENLFVSHFINVFLHTINAVMVWIILAYLGVPYGWIAAAIFAVHPVHVESVAWIAQRKNLLAGMFYLLSFFTFLRGCPIGKENEDKRDYRYIGASIFFFVCSLLSKTAFCTLPLVLFLVMWWKRTKIKRNDIVLLIPYFAAALAAAVFSVILERNHVGAQGVEWNFSLLERVLIAARALCFYFFKILRPQDLSFVYTRWTIDASLWWQYIYPLLLIVVIFSLWLLRRKWGKGPLVGFLFFISGLLPILGFVDFYYMRYSFVADHYLYIASLGVIPFIPLVVKKITCKALKEREYQLVMSVVILCLAVAAWHQTKIYKDRFTIFTDVIIKNPTNWVGYTNRANIYHDRKEYGLALADYNAAIKNNPERGSSYINRGYIYIMRRKFKLAMDDFDTALRINPRDDQGYHNKGVAYFYKGTYNLAIDNFTKAISLNPKSIDSFNNRGAIYALIGEFDLAIADFKQALAIDPDYPNIYYNRARMYYFKGDFKEAAEDVKTAEKLGFTIPAEFKKDIQNAAKKQ